jgi:Fic family protein
MLFKNKYNMTVEENILYAKRNIVDYIYGSAKLEGLTVTFPDTYAIFENGRLHGVDTNSVETIINLKHAWEYVFSSLEADIDLAYIRKLHREVARGQALSWGELRTGAVGIGGTDYKPPVPEPNTVSADIKGILSSGNSPIERAMDIMLYMMRSQLFWDGNKRVAMLTANKLMIEDGCGIISVSPELISDFSTQLSEFYTSGDSTEIKNFIYENCIDGIELDHSGK